MRNASFLAWLMLLGAIVAELVGTIALKNASMGRRLAWFAVAGGYGVALWLLELVIAQIDVSVVYALWSGIGIALIAVVGVVVFGETLSTTRALGLLAIIAGIVLLQLSGSKQP